MRRDAIVIFRFAAFLLIVLGGFGGLASARADEPATGPDSDEAPAAIPLAIRSLCDGETVEIERVLGRRQTQVVVRCSGDCVEELAPGKYRLHLYDDNGKDLGTSRLSLSWPTAVRRNDPDSRSWATFGLSLAIPATAIGVGAGTLALLSVLEESDDRTYQRAMLGGALSGLVGAVVGWTIFGQNAGLFRQERGSWAQRVAFLTAPAERGWTGGLAISF
jgi:hypothetical protein